MHETHFVEHIITVVRRKLTPKMMEYPVTVRARLSPLSHVSPVQLRAAFSVAAEAEHLTGMNLDVDLIEIEGFCRACRRIAKSVTPLAVCPSCGSVDLDIANPREFYVESIEVDPEKMK